jgi:hypothetical protein
VANPRSSKRDIAQAKRERSALKRERRQNGERSVGHGDPPPAGGSSTPPLSEAELLGALDVLHGQFENGEVGFDEFEARKAELLDRLVS